MAQIFISAHLYPLICDHLWLVSNEVRTNLKSILLKLIKFYQLFPLPKSCRFIPSCSEYTAQAIRKYGCFKGMNLGMRRLLRCHPYTQGGYDPLI